MQTSTSTLTAQGRFTTLDPFALLFLYLSSGGDNSNMDNVLFTKHVIVAKINPELPPTSNSVY